MKDILGMIGNGGRYDLEIAKELDMPLDDLKIKMEMLVRMGYLEEMGRIPDHSCVKMKCMGCPFSTGCGGNTSLKTYELTKKGNRYMCRIPYDQ